MSGWIQQLWGALPLLAWWGWVIAGRRGGWSWSVSLMRAAPAWAGMAWGLSNGLSWIGAITPDALRAGWLVGSCGVWVYAWRRPTSGRAPCSRGRDAFAGCMLACVVGLVALALITAVMSPPVTVDVLNYHAPRQLMWLQQGSLAHFMTVNDRQLMMPPLAEVIGLQFLAITGDDRWANLPQWFAYAMLPVSVATCAREAGCDRRQGWLAAWLAVCLPMAYLEAANGKNDLQEAFWVVLILYEVLKARSEAGAVAWGDAMRAGLIIGLAVLTKSTAFIFAPPLIVAAWLAWKKRTCALAACRLSVAAALVALVVTAPFFTRNLGWYGTPLGEHRLEDGGRQTNEVFGPAVWVSNMLRNATLHLAGPSEAGNRSLEEGVRNAHGWLGLSVDDGRTTCWGSEYAVRYAPREETLAGAPWHFLLIIGAVTAALFWRRAVAWRWLAWVCVAMALAYCVLLKWQPWGARLQQPVFAVGVVLVAGVASLCDGRRRGAMMLGALAAGGLVAWWPSRHATARPLWTEPSVFSMDRETLSYGYHREAQERDRAYVNLIKEAGVRDILIVSVHDMSYPLMRRLQREVPGVHFHGAPTSDVAEAPEAILRMELFRPLGLYHQMEDGSRYRLVGVSAGDGLYLPEERVRALGWRERLPTFAGWTGHDGLVFRSVGKAVWREMAGERVELRFRAWAETTRLRATVLGDSRGEQRVEGVVDGRVIGRAMLPAGAGRVDVDWSFPCHVGENRLELRRTGETANPLRFERLTFNDIMEADESALGIIRKWVADDIVPR